MQDLFAKKEDQKEEKPDEEAANKTPVASGGRFSQKKKKTPKSKPQAERAKDKAAQVGRGQECRHALNYV